MLVKGSKPLVLTNRGREIVLCSMYIVDICEEFG